MYHFKARVYSPSLGRFLQTDPAGYKDGLNLYAYAGNDPVNRTDPTGKIPEMVVTAPRLGIPGVFGAEYLSFATYGSNLPPALYNSGAGNRGGTASPKDEGDEHETEGEAPSEKDSSGRACFQDPPFQVARDFFRGINRLGNATIDAGTDLIVIGATGAVAGLPFGPEASAPGVTVTGLGIVTTGLGSVATLGSSVPLFLLGDHRTAATSFLDALGGRVLKRIPDEFAPLTNQALENLEDRMIDSMNERGADIRDCKN